MRWARIATAAAAGVLALTPLGPVSAHAADPVISSGSLLADPKAPDGSHITKATMQDSRNIRLYVYSAAMDETYPVDVQRPADASAPRPTLYLLNGAGGGVDSATWDQRAPDALHFLADKDVNVVQPIGGAWSYYTDWRAPDPTLGVNKWKTFFTEELPPLIDGALGTDGVNAIAGLSTSGTSVLQLPIAKPGLYKSVAAYSGCAQISDPTGYTFVKLAVNVWGGGNVDNMYGPENDPMWAANDPYVHADQLRGLNLFISAGSGLPGKWDTLDGPYALPGPYGLGNQLLIGGVIESAVDYCSHNLQAKLNQLGIPATYDFTTTGTHSWGYWHDALIQSWPVLAQGLGLPA
ncbi:esterase family protein [Nocardia terpenica]|uniref:Esterase n=1 Tax=Nocardia terpenica TaxID=455432 RepID=A0A164LP41_9NOCA|nr:alpha/beta hydrolase family protein [Nocardia terpenica]KZM72622.1 esterase [Nocardia terpenica]MBF6059355.1 esterase family protein [Nocardia terpenica]MBF6103106.1 esterase family protein [Nocardia terpenica]MBF6110705.1 esterase family protein [Nocardia terpenica]MBF6116836.1 esterase family protein [Nocardia terpenica]